MAVKSLQDHYTEYFRDARNDFKGFLKTKGASTVVIYDLKLPDIAKAAKKGLSLVVDGYARSNQPDHAKVVKKANTNKTWDEITKKVLKDINNDKKIGGTRINSWRKTRSKNIGQGLYFAKKAAQRKYSIKFFIFTNNESATNTLLRSIQSDIADRLWKKLIDSKKLDELGYRPGDVFLPTGGITDRKAQAQFSSQIRTEHQFDKTVAMQGTESIVEKGQSDRSIEKGERSKGWWRYAWVADIIAADVAQHVMNNVEADWGQKKTKKKLRQQIPHYVFTEVLMIKIGKNKYLDTDFPGLNNVAKEYIKASVNKQAKDQSPKVKKASPNVRDQIQSDVAVEIVKNVAGRFIDAKTGKYVKVNFKHGKSKFNTKSRRVKNVIKSSKPTVKSRALQGTFIPKVTGSKPEKGRQKPKGQTKQEDLLKIEKLINQRLPDKVRQNMGRPALINRTGRFADSTELLNLRETAAGVSGSYTYRLDPYQTFENTGSRKWPAGYNPKPLIAKSIKEIYYQYKSEQLVQLRRQ